MSYYRINPSKSQAIIVTSLSSQVVLPTNINIKLNFSTIAILDCINYLGILIDSKLLFRDHIHKVENKLSRAVGILCKLKNFNLYIWSATFKSYLERLRKLPNKAKRVINNMQQSFNNDPLFSKNKILILKDLVKLEISKLMFNFNKCKLPNFFLSISKKYLKFHSRVIRSSDNNMLYLPRYRSNCKDLLNIEKLKFEMMFHVI